MTAPEWAVLGVGIALLFAAAPWHLGGLLLIGRLQPSRERHPFGAIMVTFWGLILLHLSEIVAGAAVFAAVLSFPETGAIDGVGAGSRWSDLLFASGAAYATLGLSLKDGEGPIRLLAMLNALGGFLLITWSATFVYSIWSNQFRDDDLGGDDSDAADANE